MDLSGYVQTVLGPVDPDEIGPTTTHEHLLIDFTMMFKPPTEASEKFKAFAPVTLHNLGWIRYNPFRNLDNLKLFDESVAINETLEFKAHGGKTIVDATTMGIGRDPQALARISRVTGTNIVMGAGYYVDPVHPQDMNEKSVEEIGEQIVNEIRSGVGDTGVKAGIIGELGCSWPLTENERKVLLGAAYAQGNTGAPILIHPGRNIRSPFEIVDILGEAGADVGRVIMGHLDRTILDRDVLIEFAQLGTYLEYDLFGWEASYYPLSEIDIPSDAQRIGFIKNLVDEGYSERIVLAHDVWGKHSLKTYGGYGLSHILENIVPRILEKGMTEIDVNNMTVANPARILTFA